MKKQDRYTIEMYNGDSLIERIIILTDKYPLVYKIASFWFDDDKQSTKCYVLWEDVVLAKFTNAARLDSVQQIPPSL